MSPCEDYDVRKNTVIFREQTKRQHETKTQMKGTKENNALYCMLRSEN